MKLVAHISDPHFGTEDPRIKEALTIELKTIEPAVVAISGDLTQRGRRRQFRDACRWIHALGLPHVVVPGNHDIPFYDVFTRFLRPRNRYFRYISKDLTPTYFDDELAVCGIDTTKRFTTKHGEVKEHLLDEVVAELRAHSEAHWKIVVAHHPFVVPVTSDEPTVDGARQALAQLESAGIDMILTGHLHIPHSDGSAGRNERHTIINVHAGTCMSKRVRGHVNGYNQLRFAGDEVTILHREWNGTMFVDGDSKSYLRKPSGERMVKIAESPPNPDLFTR